MTLLIHLVVLVLVFCLLYWLITLVVTIVPPPMQNPVRVVLLVSLVLIAISYLLGEAGLWGDWGAGYHGPHVVHGPLY
jgi:hypothetical protein